MSYDQEYFCPHCGAILNNQPGFDPDNGTWTCTECGQLLMDNDVYEGDTFEGVAWYCDRCGALLNRQDGFSDAYGSWKCTECGCVNGTTGDDIINGFKCPCCGATLDIQSCFSEYQSNWTCTECGAHLYHRYGDDEYTVIKHFCPNCEAPLDIQIGFLESQSNWDCAECGAHLHHEYSFDEFEEIEDDYEEDEDEDDEEVEEEEDEDDNEDDEDDRPASRVPNYNNNRAEYKRNKADEIVEGISQIEFERICNAVAKQFRQIARIQFSGPRVTCVVRPRIGRSWTFYLELREDNNHIWGQQYKRNNIPEQYVSLVLYRLEELRKEKTKKRRENDRSTSKSNKVNYCPYCGTFVNTEKGRYCHQCGKKL